MAMRLSLRGLVSNLGASFRTKIILGTMIGVLIGLVATATSGVLAVRELGRESSRLIDEGLSESNREYLENYIGLVAQRTNLVFDRAYSEINMLTEITQTLFDERESLGDLIDRIAEHPFFKDDLIYNAAGKWYQNPANEPAVVTVWGDLLNPDETIREDVREHIKTTALLDLLLPSFSKIGEAKQWMYLVGPEDGSYLRLAPYVDMGSDFDRLYPGHNDEDFWRFFFPGLAAEWRRWIENPSVMAAYGDRVVFTPPYEDAAGSGFIVSLFRPFWNAERTSFAGAIGLDFTLENIASYIRDVRIAQTGFAFIVRDNGNMIAVNERGQRIMGLRAREVRGGEASSLGVSVLERNLSDSANPVFRNLDLPSDYEAHYSQAGDYVVVLKRLLPVLALNESRAVTPEYWTLGFVVPTEEIYASLNATQGEIEEATAALLTEALVIVAITLALVFFGTISISTRLTQGLTRLSVAADQLRRGDYNVEVSVNSRDELQRLAFTFNDMVAQIRRYTRDLEELVRERTGRLEKANEKIQRLNNQLQAENLRLSAEVAVARKLQMMVLPRDTDFKGVVGLDIAGYMEPADEVGGDYYEVLTQRGNQRTKIGIGDVTGHGLESGVVMLMTQTAVLTVMECGVSDAREFYNIINRVIHRNISRIRSDKNMTLSLLDYDPGSGRFQLTGQHEEVLVVRASGEVEIVDTMELGVPLGLAEDISEFTRCLSVSVESGDLVALYTDGITEAENDAREQYGLKRLVDVLRAHHGASAEAIRERVVNDINAFIGGHRIWDDITLLVMKKW